MDFYFFRYFNNLFGMTLFITRNNCYHKYALTDAIMM
jgi:hypothetical protein